MVRGHVYTEVTALSFIVVYTHACVFLFGLVHSEASLMFSFSALMFFSRIHHTVLLA